MRRLTSWMMLTAALVMVAAIAVPASAQVFTGRIEVTAIDSTGAVLPGATLELNGPQKASAVSDAREIVRFLSPGIYW